MCGSGPAAVGHTLGVLQGDLNCWGSLCAPRFLMKVNSGFLFVNTGSRLEKQKCCHTDPGSIYLCNIDTVSCLPLLLIKFRAQCLSPSWKVTDLGYLTEIKTQVQFQHFIAGLAHAFMHLSMET